MTHPRRKIKHSGVLAAVKRRGASRNQDPEGHHQTPGPCSGFVCPQVTFLNVLRDENVSPQRSVTISNTLHSLGCGSRGEEVSEALSQLSLVFYVVVVMRLSRRSQTHLVEQRHPVHDQVHTPPET